MEKDYFLDRPSECRQFLSIKEGSTVLICLKKNQKTAKSINDLTECIVCRHLTRQDHPRGCKIEGLTKDGELVVGRVTYLVIDDKILTKDGLKGRKDIK